MTPEPAACPTCETVTEPWSWCDTVQRYVCEACDRVFVVRCVVGQRDSGGQNAPNPASVAYTGERKAPPAGNRGLTPSDVSGKG